MTKRAWLREPLATASMILVVFVAWLAAYTVNAMFNGVAPPYSSGFDVVIRLGVSALTVVAVLAPWIGLAVLGNYLLRRRGGFGLRLLITFIAAEILCLPVAIWAGIALTHNDGWRGLGALSFAAPVIAPILVVLAHLLAAAFLQAVTIRRDVAR
ncbi:MAG: hypothetical protein QOH55_2402 [Microbacteriaceae bacterium]|jgi:hypothetical protein|nr:hypothetical protein [Microbacteriaceae bacterium]